MIYSRFTDAEIHVIKNALETEYYHAKDEGDVYTQKIIENIENKISGQFSEEDV